MNSWILWVIIGVIAIIGGIIALLNPIPATLAANTIAAWFFIIGGILSLVGVFVGGGGWGQRIWALILGLAFLWLGISLLQNPLAGIVALTIVAAVTFLVTGTAKIIFAFGVRGTGYFWPTILSGVISVILAIMVFTNFPQSAAVLLGVLLAVELIASGATLVSFGMFLKNSDRETAA